MRTARTAAEVRREVAALRVQRSGRVGLVPTMGALHDGHLALLRRARAECESVVMSLFVNPTQFAAGEDLDSYPRDEVADLEQAEAAGVDLVFAPARTEVYPPGFATWVEVEGLTDVLCGDPSRRGREHFRGVTTVVTKLVNIVRPDVAYFGQKDAQQALVIRRMARDLEMAVEIAVSPTVRDSDGLALSSRNAYLDDAERERALALSRALAAAEAAVEHGELEAGVVLAAASAELDAAGVDPEYLELRALDDLDVADRVNGSTLLAVAARIGRARLIDNTILEAG